MNWWIRADGAVPEYRLACSSTFTSLARAGWIAYSRNTYSLCSGRLFHTLRYGNRVSQEPPATVGYLVARRIGIHRRLNNRASPTWDQIAEATTDTRGVPVFFDARDAQSQQHWLEAQQWIRIVDRQLRRGERAKTETRRRTALRKATTLEVA
ncbi:hypothetical protein NLM24_04715 [Nocardia zapadnayensis]|nr:hypothetical protein [Nocardia zapadnayensis]MCX0270021.1 hypothetical protein [Nocardia zapadnayensis]